LCRCDVQRRCTCRKTFRASRKPFRARAKTVRLPSGITVRLQPGIVFVFTPESFSRSPRNPFRLAPESAASNGSGNSYRRSQIQRCYVARELCLWWQSLSKIQTQTPGGDQPSASQIPPAGGQLVTSGPAACMRVTAMFSSLRRRVELSPLRRGWRGNYAEE
jgi:hypothetical protein